MSTKNYLRVKLNGTDFPALKSIVLHFIQRVIWLWNLEPLIAFLTTWIKLVIFRQWANCYFKLWYSALSTASFYNHWRQIVSTQTYVNEKSFLHRL